MIATEFSMNTCKVDYKRPANMMWRNRLQTTSQPCQIRI